MIRRRKNADEPDVEAAREELDRAKGRRDEVDRLVASLQRERHLNNFTANVIATFRGGN